MPIPRTQALSVAECNTNRLLSVHDEAYLESWDKQTQIIHPSTEGLLYKEEANRTVSSIVKIHQSFSQLVGLSEKLQIADSSRNKTDINTFLGKIKHSYGAVIDEINRLAVQNEECFQYLMESSEGCGILFYLMINLNFQGPNSSINKGKVDEFFRHLRNNKVHFLEPYASAFEFLFLIERNPETVKLTLKSMSQAITERSNETGVHDVLMWLNEIDELNFIGKLPLFLKEYIYSQLTICIVRESLKLTKEEGKSEALFFLMKENKYLLNVDCQNPCAIGSERDNVLFHAAKLFKKFQLQGCIYHLNGQLSKVFQECSDLIAELFFLTIFYNEVGTLSYSEKSFLISIFRYGVSKLEERTSPFNFIGESHFWALGAKAYLDNLEMVSQDVLLSFYQNAPRIIEKLMPTQYLLIANQLIRNIVEFNSIARFDSRESEASLTFYMDLFSLLLLIDELKLALKNTSPLERKSMLAFMLTGNKELLIKISRNQKALFAPKNSRFSFLKKQVPLLVNDCLSAVLDNDTLAENEITFKINLAFFKRAIERCFQYLKVSQKHSTELEVLFSNSVGQAEKTYAASSSKKSEDNKKGEERANKSLREQSTIIEGIPNEPSLKEMQGEEESFDYSPEVLQWLKDEAREKEAREQEKESARQKEKEDKIRKAEREKAKHDRHQISIANKLINTKSPIHNDKIYISREALPRSFMSFVDVVHRLTNKNLILVGGAVTSLYLRAPLETINDYDCVILDFSLQELYNRLNQDEAFKGRVQAIGKPPMIKLLKVSLYDESGRTIEVDINAIERPGPDKTLAISHYLKKVDFKLAALYMELSGEPLIIRGVAGAIRSIEAKCIALIEKEGQCIYRDPISLLRLIKLMFKYSDFSLDGALIRVLRTIDLVNLFDDFISGTGKRKEQGQINTALMLLFERFPEEVVVKALIQLRIFQALTGFNEEQTERVQLLYKDYVNDSDRPLTGQEKKERFYFVVCSIYLNENGSENFKKWLFMQFARRISLANGAAYDDMEHRICGAPEGAKMYSESFGRMINNVLAFSQKKESTLG